MLEYKVLMLGPRGAGKTVYLSSMFYKMSTAGPRGFFLKANQELRHALSQRFYALTAAGKWPVNTIDLHECYFDITVPTRNPTANYEACKITYFDYGGGRLTGHADPDESKELERCARQADVLMALLDGAKLRRILFRGDRRLRQRFFQIDLKAIADTLQIHPQHTIHFVISKWDLFEDTNRNIELIRDELLRYEPFQNVILDRVHGGLVRFIPVSSVGSNFVEPTSEYEKGGSWEMTINESAEVQPFQVEFPFACILPDLFEQGIKATAQRESDLDNKLNRLTGAPLDPGFSKWEKMRSSLGNVFRSYSDNIADAVEGSSVRNKLRESRRIRRMNLEETEHMRARVHSQQSAFQFAFEVTSSMVEELDAKYPSARIPA